MFPRIYEKRELSENMYSEHCYVYGVVSTHLDFFVLMRKLLLSLNRLTDMAFTFYSGRKLVGQAFREPPKGRGICGKLCILCTLFGTTKFR